MKIIIFIGLKIVEIAVIIFVPYYVGKLAKHILDDDDIPSWILGVAVLMASLILILLSYMLITTNWEWAGKLMEKS